MLDLTNLYKTLNWFFNQKDRIPGKEVGIFAVLPEEIASQFPKTGRDGEDSSPVHITILYLNEIPLELENKVVKIVEDFCSNFKSFKVKLAKPKEWVNDEGQVIIHSPIKSNKLHKFHDELKATFASNQIYADTKYPEFKPHSTIAYTNEESKADWKEYQPEGEWEIDKIWIWGLEKPHLIHLK